MNVCTFRRSNFERLIFPFLKDGWTCNFTSFQSTVFQSYQDDGRVIMKGCVQWNPVYDWKDLRLRRGSNPGPLVSRPALKLRSFVPLVIGSNLKGRICSLGANSFLSDKTPLLAGFRRPRKQTESHKSCKNGDETWRLTLLACNVPGIIFLYILSLMSRYTRTSSPLILDYTERNN